jgi:membrane protease YdiL (CAAX protease family)
MIGSRLFSFTSDRNRLAVQTAVLAALFLMRFLVHTPGFLFYAAITYTLSYVFFLTIPAEERRLYHLTRPSKKIIKVAIFVALLGMAAQIAIDYFCFGDIFVSLPSLRSKTLFFIGLMTMIALQFCIAALLEEPLFRGFFWGYLRKFKVSDFLILCIQAIIFWAAHFYYADTPAHWLLTLICGLVFGVVAWKTKSIFASMLVHACYNSTSFFFSVRHIL